MKNLLSHLRAGTGAVLVSGRNERQLLASLVGDSSYREVCYLAAPSGSLTDARTGAPIKGAAGMASAYSWLASSPGRACLVYDWHMLSNAPGHWRMLSDALPGIRSPQSALPGDPASLAVFVGPTWDLAPANPLRGLLPIIPMDPPDREAIRSIAERLHRLNGDAEQIVDALCGLDADAAEQAAAEVLSSTGGTWDLDKLREARRSALRQAGLEIWAPVSELGGLSGLTSYAESEIIPWIRDAQLSIRRILCAGLPGTGKSYCARWLAQKIGCECARLSIPALKAGIVGASEANLRRALSTLDAIGKHSPIVCVVDEVDSIARDGMDGGVSSGLFSELLTWLQESKSQVIVLATLNHLDKLDAALESRFQARFFFDLPSAKERQSISAIHFKSLGCADLDGACATTVAQCTEGFSSREIAQQLIPSVARRSLRNPIADHVISCAREVTPASITQREQLDHMRRAASSLRRANDAPETTTPGSRRVG